MTTIICVLRSGGDFKPEHVFRLKRQVDQYGTFVCLTDQPQDLGGISTFPLIADYPGWWSKVSIFAIYGPVLYLDLDVNIMGDLTPIIEAIPRYQFITCRSLWEPDLDPYLNSSVTGWSGDISLLLRSFMEDPNFAILGLRLDKWLQEWALPWASIKTTFWQDICPDMICSYNRLVDLGNVDLSNCRILVSQCNPRPWEYGGADDCMRSQIR